MRLRESSLFVPCAPIVLASLYVLAGGCTKGSTPATDAGSGTPVASDTGGKTGGDAGPAKALDKLKIDDVKVGTGPGAKNGDTVSVIYTGKLADGTTFDTNDKASGQPFRFKLGAGSVIKGWDEGLIGMKKGGERKLSIPAELAYGSRAQAKIPPDSDLFFDVKLTTILSADELTTVQRSTMKKGTGPALKEGDTAVVNYTLSGDDGSIIDDKFAKKTYSFVVGGLKGPKVLPVIDKAMRGMKQGGEISLKMPQMYGPHGPQFEGNAMYTADITLVKVISK
jgi:FKBP-type peptidyl-prolyl cis-trans isomerase